jgi:hypothetical protein
LKLLILFIFSFSFSLYSSERSIFESEVSRYYTSDDFSITQTSLSFKNNRRNLFWSYKDNAEKATDLGAIVSNYSGNFREETYQAVNASIYLGKKWNFKNYTTLTIGSHSFSYDDSDFSIATYELTHEIKLSNSANVKFAADRNFQYIQQQIPATLQDGLVRESYQINWVQKFGDNLRAPLMVRRMQISDGNGASEYDASLLYGRVYPVWWWIGYGVNQLKYNTTVLGYWSPEEFIGHGPRFEISYPIVQNFQVSGGYNYSLIKEANFDQGTSSYSSIGLEYGDRNEWIAKLNWIELISEQASNEWTSEGYVATFNKSF